MKKNSVRIPQEEIDKQVEFIRKIKKLNDGNLKKYTIQTFGCQMNEHDSENLAGMLLDMGYIKTDSIEETDFIIFNTCCVREHAEEKIIGRLGRLRKLKERKPGLLIAVCGCMMQQTGVPDRIMRRFKHVNLIFGTHNIYKFPELVFNSIELSIPIYDVWNVPG